jgi:hypothetical protein
MRDRCPTPGSGWQTLDEDSRRARGDDRLDRCLRLEASSIPVSTSTCTGASLPAARACAEGVGVFEIGIVARSNSTIAGTSSGSAGDSTIAASKPERRSSWPSSTVARPAWDAGGFASRVSGAPWP